MIETSNRWRDAVTGGVRRVRVRIPARIVDPDLEYGAVTASSEAAFSRTDEVIDGVFSGAGDYATGEINRWILGGPQSVMRSTQAQVGYAVDWEDISSTTYPLGWHRGYYDQEDGTHHDSNYYIRTSGVPVSSTFVKQTGATRLVCAAPAGYAIAAFEYDETGAFVRRHGEMNSTLPAATNALDIRFPAGHKFRFSVGREVGMGNPESENYKLGDDTFVSAVTATFYVMAYDGQVGYVSDSLSGSDGTFSAAPEVEVTVSGVEALRAVTVQFPEGEADGYGVDFTVSASASGTVLDSVNIADNRERRVLVPLMAANPDAVTVTVSRWSLPGRRARIVEIFPGYAVDWSGSDITSLNVKHQCSLSAMQQPYSTAAVTLDNSGSLFDPLDKSSMFQSIEEGQGFPVELGIDEGAETEYVPMGVFYHHNQGWSQRDGNMTMQFDLVDIIGLLADVDFAAPETVPTTLAGWLSAIVACLGTRFEGHCAFDPEYLADYQITAAAEDVGGKKCTELLRMLCQASGCLAVTRRADGYLMMRSAIGTGMDLTLDELAEYPVFSANDYMGSITFSLPDGEGGTADYQIYGPDNTSKNTARIQSPFITTQSAATEIAERIFSAYGGNKIALRGRGEPSAELGDVVSVETKTGADASGRILSQTFKYAGGVLEGCQTELLHTETRYNTYGHRVVFTQDGTWTVPEGVTSVHAVLIGGGDGGGHGVWMPSQLYPTPQDVPKGISVKNPGNVAVDYNDPNAQATSSGVVLGGWDGIKRVQGADHDYWVYDPEANYLTAAWKMSAAVPTYGEAGKGGKVLSREVSVNPGETMNVVIGQGGEASGYGVISATPGTPTTFGPYTSDNGERYAGAYTDIFSGGTYSKPGQTEIIRNSGNGGYGGKTVLRDPFGKYTGEPYVIMSQALAAYTEYEYHYGANGEGYWMYVPHVTVPYAWTQSSMEYYPTIRKPIPGTKPPQYEYVFDDSKQGGDGSSGICVIYYNDPPEEEEA